MFKIISIIAVVTFMDSIILHMLLLYEYSIHTAAS